ncbi:pyridoxamine 5'-phosphate oxidase family protein [Paenibacillus crassostreae]|uniref:General stress protein n=1 Tax=Paenibacillus crassostreae TaxID=1763538 RepID=A0A162KR46_9BACL|nr:pyridoxamine 5'-phosphate oxidase family protein [Paenibacillus crassostreae]AOZ94650.1 general stress protein [Paenibacillus crassostreae]OAB72553.1 general stress protein [Paenibacillus crassostreae]
MEKTMIEQEITKILDRNKICSLATIEGNKPKQRYMVLFNEGLSLHLATDLRTHKVEELKNNPNISLLLGYEIGGTKDSLEIEGTCSISTNDSLKEKVWNDDLKEWFDGPKDPNYGILDVHITRILYQEKGGKQREWIA